MVSYRSIWFYRACIALPFSNRNLFGGGEGISTIDSRRTLAYFVMGIRGNRWKPIWKRATFRYRRSRKDRLIIIIIWMARQNMKSRASSLWKIFLFRSVSLQMYTYINKKKILLLESATEWNICQRVFCEMYDWYSVSGNKTQRTQ